MGRLEDIIRRNREAAQGGVLRRPLAWLRVLIGIVVLVLLVLSFLVTWDV